jgi:hypothetical protein
MEGSSRGYLTRVRWCEDLGIALAIQVNTSDFGSLPGWAEATVLDRAVEALTNGKASPDPLH